MFKYIQKINATIKDFMIAVFKYTKDENINNRNK